VVCQKAQTAHIEWDRAQKGREVYHPLLSQSTEKIENLNICTNRFLNNVEAISVDYDECILKYVYRIDRSQYIALLSYLGIKVLLADRYD